ncbi:SDR family NAD(P)-dependent oxidoreductase [Sandaracinobacter neustonicus]|uniref:SDR family NAD(P)-dependent oxidoreductase n=1 Tax=Sandaracinobacter neustonicus TaxID=1715348 RepID=A0A501XNC6_9SPHN|nr:SDR family NAD(P)-dependent oxidoreductase [Sandaracinobacter neustonicus]TPE62171.1 SDR family NAD(P)-dependent oxidoreductase [Sandaracinobacter neustonicus]
MSIRFDNRVAIVTGAGNGLGRRYALDLAARGAKVVVNDLGGARDGSGSSVTAAQAVVDEIVAAGGEAMASGASVTDADAIFAMVDEVKAKWGRIDILINNAGILRDKTFTKMTLDDFRLVLDVHLMGGVICTKAVWDLMREQAYGRILMTTSSTGLYGNFGQANYGAAKLGLVGLMKTLALEGAKYNVKVNTVAPLAATRMTEDLMPPELLAKMGPETVSPASLYLVSEDAPTNVILNAGGGGFEAAHVTLTKGVHVAADAMTPETVAAKIADIRDRDGEIVPDTGAAQAQAALSGGN